MPHVEFEFHCNQDTLTHFKAEGRSDRFLNIPHAIYWNVVFKFIVIVALGALSNIHFGFYKNSQTFFHNF